MRGGVAVCIVFLVALVCAQSANDGVRRTDRGRVDIFSFSDDSILTQTGPGTAFENTFSVFIVGTERDEFLSVFKPQDSATSFVGGGESTWQLSCTGNCRGTLQYDGLDNDVQISKYGLSTFNFGSLDSDSFHLAIKTNRDVDVRISMYDGDESCVYFWTALGRTDGAFIEYYIKYDDFIGNVDVFRNTGALELVITCIGGCDTEVDYFNWAGPIDKPVIIYSESGSYSFNTNSFTSNYSTNYIDAASTLSVSVALLFSTLIAGLFGF